MHDRTVRMVVRAPLELILPAKRSDMMAADLAPVMPRDGQVGETRLPMGLMWQPLKSFIKTMNAADGLLWFFLISVSNSTHGPNDEFWSCFPVLNLKVVGGDTVD